MTQMSTNEIEAYQWRCPCWEMGRFWENSLPWNIAPFSHATGPHSIQRYDWHPAMYVHRIANTKNNLTPKVNVMHQYYIQSEMTGEDKIRHW